MLKRYQNPGDEELMADIRAGGILRESAWYYITKDWGGSVMGSTRKATNCRADEAREAFSEAVVSVEDQIRKKSGNFLTYSLKAYLTKVSINAAYAILTKPPLAPEMEEEEDLRKYFDKNDCAKVMDQALNGIGPRCKELLKLFFDGYSMKEIAEKMGFKDADAAKKQKYKCWERFLKYLEANPKIIQQIEGNCHD